MQKEQIESVLAVLKNIDKCICAGVNYLPGTETSKPFNLNLGAGVCWNVMAYTDGNLDIGTSFLNPVFEELNYTREHPVESTLMPSAGVEVWRKYYYNTQCMKNIYDTTTPHGKVRHMLVEKLIAYFEKKLEIVLYYTAQVQ